MPFQISPGVNVTEIDLTTIVPAVATTEGAIAGVFRWGPIDQRVLIDSENKLITRFGKPTNLNAETFFTAANFLGYGNRLYVSRAANTTAGTANDVMTALAIEGAEADNFWYMTSAVTINTAANSTLVNFTSGAIPYYITKTSDQITIESGNTTVLFTSGNTDMLSVGMKVVGTNISDGTTVSSITNTTAVVISAAPTGADSGSYTFGNTSGVSDNTTFATADLFNFSGNNISSNTRISRFVNTTAFVISQAATGNSSGIYALSDVGELLIDAVTFNIKNEDQYNTRLSNGDFNNNGDVVWAAKYPGEMGNSLKISVCDSANAWYSTFLLDSAEETSDEGTRIRATVGSNNLNVRVRVEDYSVENDYSVVNLKTQQAYDSVTIGDIIEVGNGRIGRQFVRVTSKEPITNAYYSYSNNLTLSSGNTTVVLASGNTDNFDVGMKVVGINVPGNSTVNTTTIASIINTTAFTLSAAPTGANSGSYYVYRSDATFDIKVNNKVRIKKAWYGGRIKRYWEYFGSFDKAPDQSTYLTSIFAENTLAANGNAKDELHVVVVDEDGKFTGVPGTILEKFEGLSRITSAKNNEGSSIYYRDAINLGSQYIWWVNDRVGSPSADAFNIASATTAKPLSLSLLGGRDGDGESEIDALNLYNAYDLFMSAEDIDVSLILQGKAVGGDRGQQLANYIIDNICEVRKDCVVFISPNYDSVINNAYQEVDDVIAFRDVVTASSYAVLDSGYKYQYDRYNDVYRWVPLNGDIAGLCARTDNVRDPWYSPAGFNRGIIKNVIKLAYNPSKAERDSLYKKDINPVINVPGTGTILYGDKTLLGKPSAFDRINVRRLFIVLEKAIATASKYTLFEFNDAFTRAQFVNLIEPYLRDVQGRRGIYDFKVVCDETNNTPEVIDRNEFVGDIYIKPARSINFIQLNFIAVRTGVDFNEIIGLRSA